MKAILAMDRNFAIGKGNQLLTTLKGEMKYFREQTKGKALIMGRKTLESFPEQKPLPFRENLVLSRDKNYKVDGAQVFHSKEEILNYIKKYDKDDVFVIGGAKIYKLFLDDVDEILITKIDHVFSDADAFFYNIDEDKNFKCISESGTQEECGYKYTYTVYKRI